MAVAIIRRDLDAAGLRRAASRSQDAGAARRMLALALVLEGWSRTEAARACGMDHQTLRDWVHRYNEEGLSGLSGLSDWRVPGPPPQLTPGQQAEVVQWVRQRPDLAEHGVVRWRRIDLARVIERRFGGGAGRTPGGELLTPSGVPPASRRAALLPLPIRAWSCARSSPLSLTTYRFTAPRLASPPCSPPLHDQRQRIIKFYPND